MNTPVPVPPRPLSDCAVIVSSQDNVAIVKYGLSRGDRIELPDGRVLTLSSNVPAGHRFATHAIPQGGFVLQYGAPIGTSQGIEEGGAITSQSMSNEVPTVRELPSDLSNPAPDYVPSDQLETFQGYLRPDGRVGTRNMLLIVPTSMCSSHEAAQIALKAEYTLLDKQRFPNVDGIVALPHNKGCGCNDGEPLNILLRTLRNYADHPNVGGVIFIELGCEKTNLSMLSRYLKGEGGALSWNKPERWMGVQEAGGTLEVIEKGLEAVAEILPEVNATSRSTCPVSKLTMGVKCGGSDGFSGISANPSLGHTSDLIIRHRGTVLITEVPEFCGAEHVFAARARDAAVGQQIYETVDWYKDYAGRIGARLDDNPSPGNRAGGLLNIAIKSLGAIAKAGTTRVEGCTPYAQPPSEPGLHLMQGPGYDQESTPGLIAAGAQVVVFTTGRGTTIGNAIAPVIKLASNTRVFERMRGDLDLSAGGIIDGTESIEEVGQRVFNHLLKVASGEVLAKAEETGHREFQFWAGESISL